MFSYKPLMRQLLERDMNKKMLKEALGLSPVTMAKFSKNEPVSMETLDSLCNYFDCEIEDIIISEATKGKFGIFIKNSNLDFQQIIPELEADSYLVDNYGDYIGIYW